MKLEERFWSAFAIITVSLIVTASMVWIHDHPFGIDWDESEYFDRALADVARFQDGGLYNLGTSIVLEDTIRPPAYRLLAIPFTFLFGFSPATVRLVSIAFFVTSLFFVYLATRRIAGSVVSASFAVLFLCLSPIMILSSMIFGTEYGLLLATAAMLYFLFRNWNSEQESTRNWIGLGVALGFGALAKTSFALVAGPILGITFFLVFRKLIIGPSYRFLLKAIALGTCIGLPWWLLNIRPALWYARYGSTYRSSLGAPSLENWAKWLDVFTQTIVGPALIILLVCILLMLILAIVTRRGLGLDQGQKTVLWACLLTPLPLLLQAPLLGTNYNPRFLAPALIPATIGASTLAKTLFQAHFRLLTVSASALFAMQLLMTIYPTIHSVIAPTNLKLFEIPPWVVMARNEQWDWESLRELALSKGIKEPSISFLGSATQWNWAAITYPWALHKDGVKEINWLWRYEEGPINWEKIMSSIGTSDMVLTAPNYVGYLGDKQDIDNQYNQEFAERLGNDPRFVGPIHLTMGRFEHVDITVYVNRAVYAQR